MKLLTSKQIDKQWFTSRRFLFNPVLRGYDEEEVDDFLDEVVETVQAYEKMCMALDRKLHNISGDRLSTKFIKELLQEVGWGDKIKEPPVGN